MSKSQVSTDSARAQRYERIRVIVKDCLLARADGKIVADETPQELIARSPSGKLDDVFRDITLAENLT